MREIDAERTCYGVSFTFETNYLKELFRVDGTRFINLLVVHSNIVTIRMLIFYNWKIKEIILYL